MKPKSDFNPNSIENRLMRIETRLCILMEALGVDPAKVPTLKVVETIHKATTLINNPMITRETRRELKTLRDAALSFTAFYLKYPNPDCRSEQFEAYKKLESEVERIEKEIANERAA